MKEKRNRDRERGSVSVYFMIVLSAMFVFEGVLLDLARIHAAILRAQQAADAAMRSVYAGFDPELQKYGLYGVETGGSAEEIFRHVFERNLDSPGIVTGRGNWIALEPYHEGFQLRHGDRLSDPEVFRYQILEEMKVRAPIEYALNVIDKWNGSDALESARQTSLLSKRMEKIEKLLMERNDRLRQAETVLSSIVGPSGMVTGWHLQNAEAHQEMDKLAGRIRDQSADVLRSKLRRVKEDLRELRDRWREETDPEQKDKLEEAIEDKEDDADDLEDLIDDIEDFLRLVAEHDLKLKLQEQELQIAAERVTRLLDEAKSLNRQAREEAGKLDASLREAVRVHDNAEYDRWYSGIAEISSRYAAYSVQFDPAELLKGTDFLSRRDRLERMNDAIVQAASSLYGAYSSWHGQLRSREQELERRKQGEKDTAKGHIRQAMAAAASCSPVNEPIYQQLSERLNRYRSDGGSGDEGDDNPETNHLPDHLRALEPETVIGDSFKLAGRLQTALLAVRDRAYVIEYALTKFNYRTMEQHAKELSNPALHVLPRQEAEYVLYGWNSCYLNHGSAYAEMFMLRLAIRTAEYMMSPEKSLMSFGSPWLVFLWAVAEGARSALQDMEKLVSGFDVEISSRLPSVLNMNYKDYLRLFMLLHGNETAMLARMQALIDLNTGSDLRERASVSEGKAEAGLRPWLLPAISGWLGYEARDGRIVIPAQSAQAY